MPATISQHTRAFVDAYRSANSARARCRAAPETRRCRPRRRYRRHEPNSWAAKQAVLPKTNAWVEPIPSAPVPPHAAWLVDLDGTLYSAPPVRLCMLGELSLAGWRVLPTLRRFRSEQEQLRRSQNEPGDPYRVQIERTALARGITAAEVERMVEEWMLERPAKWLWLFRRATASTRTARPPEERA